MTLAPRVARLTLFKHGIAFVERSGQSEGSFDLSFRREEMSDVLKSLAVWVEEGDVRVGAVGFEPPEDPEAELRERGLLLTPGAGLHELAHALRGRRVAVRTGAKEHEGEIVGWQAGSRGAGEPLPDRLLLRSNEDTLSAIPLDAMSSLRVLEERSREDLELLVDKSRASTARERKRVRVALSGPADNVRCAYVVPAPVWRVSYRLVVEREGDADKLTVLAWAIVHNPLDEAISQVELVLTTGQPVSFMIDLYHPRHVQRAVVEESTRVAGPPRQFERERAKAKGAPSPAAPPAPPPGLRAMAVSGAAPQGFGGARLEESADTFAAATDTTERAELFEYRIRDALDLARGGSAMVPLSAARVEARRERIWRQGQGLAPDVVLRFDNHTGLVLEEGAAVVYADGSYAGETMVPYSARSAEVRVGYAKDLSLRCRDEQLTERRFTSLRFAKNVSLESHENRLTHTLHAESDHREEVEVIFELPRLHGRSLSEDSVQPSASTANQHRFTVKVPAGGEAKIVVTEVWRDSHHFQLPSLDAGRIHYWLAQTFLSEKIKGALKDVLSAWSQRDRERELRVQHEAEIRRLAEQQSTFSRQLEVLREGGEEGALRLRTVKQLGELGDRVAELDQQARAAEQRAVQHEASAAALLAAMESQQG